MILVLLADGFEEIEALTPVDMLRRAGCDVKTVSAQKESGFAVGSHGIKVECDLLPEEVNLSEIETVIFPGGMPGAVNLDGFYFTDVVINEILKRGGRLAAICAAPLVLGRRGLLKGKRATCYPGFESELLGATLSCDAVVTDGNITTARGMGAALEFAEELVRLAVGEEAAAKISDSIMKQNQKS
jgi:4-methyl-5(b-hydroxyethyl)-thiazole monophosphate biosynthesis